MSLITLILGVAISSVAFSSRTKTLALVQNGVNHHHGQFAKHSVTGTRMRQINAFETNILSSSFSSSYSYYFSTSSSLLANTNQDEDVDPDLFDFFDPLLSPHAYPSGVSPEKKPSLKSNDEIQEHRQRSFQQNEDRGLKKEFGIRLPNVEQNENNKKPSSSSTKGELGFKIQINAATSSSTMEEKKDEKEVDLFDYFDPLRSPHDYPDGIKLKTESTMSETAPPSLEVVGDNEEVTGSSVLTNPNNTGKKKKVGILLMDHGSKKKKSNARLQAMAELYQMTLGFDEDEEDNSTTTIFVRAAHMEIVTPSIPDGLKELKDLGVDEIICHPFFLSPGRHVKEDIPEIIENAIEELWGESTGAKPIPIVTTAPVGSNTQLMLGAIHSLVLENSQYLKTSLQN